MSPTDNCQKYIPCDTSTANCCGCKVSMSLHIILLSKISLWCWLSVCNVFSGLQKSLQLRIWAHLAFLSWSFFICRCSATTCLRRIGVAQWILLFQVAPSRFNAASSSHHIGIMRIASKIMSGATNSQKAVRVERIVRSTRVEIKESPFSASSYKIDAKAREKAYSNGRWKLRNSYGKRTFWPTGE